MNTAICCHHYRLARIFFILLLIGLLLGACAKPTAELISMPVASAPTAAEFGSPPSQPMMAARANMKPMPVGWGSSHYANAPEPMGTEEYGVISENRFLDVMTTPLSTFSVDVDTAAYANLRRMLTQGRWPIPGDAVRIEELINYFNYDYPQPTGDEPVAIVQELSTAPWNPEHRLLHIGLQAQKIELTNLPPNNLVFLLDVSGSMSRANKLPLLKKALKMLTLQMRPEDRVAIVVYAGAAGVILPPTSGTNQQEIIAALDKLEAGGSTAGGRGIALAYELARKSFNPEGNNRVILATDGDFNVGPSSDGELVRMIEKERESGIALTVLGFGSGNYKDAKMEQLADHGNGNYAYIDSLLEARKVLVEEMGSTLLTVAKDVKVQVEFNPARVKSYRLIGYENRLLAAEDFDDDKKDAGEMGAGHSVTALYEIIPRSKGEEVDGKLRYQSTVLEAESGTETAFIKFRYKQPQGDKSKLLSVTIPGKATPLAETSEDFRFSAAVAEWGMLLRDSEYKGNASYPQLLKRIVESKGVDKQGLRGEFLQLVKRAESASELGKL